ncbi:MAG: hypothetical protein ACUVTG_09370 [Candidatus Oleimicrobiaceae bacterium]
MPTCEVAPQIWQVLGEAIVAATPPGDLCRHRSKIGHYRRLSQETLDGPRVIVGDARTLLWPQ